MKFFKLIVINIITFFLFNKKTPLCISIENENVDIVKLLLSYQSIDVNRKLILNFFFIKFFLYDLITFNLF